MVQSGVCDENNVGRRRGIERGGYAGRPGREQVLEQLRAGRSLDVPGFAESLDRAFMRVFINSRLSPGPACRLRTSIALVDPGTPSSNGRRP